MKDSIRLFVAISLVGCIAITWGCGDDGGGGPKFTQEEVDAKVEEANAELGDILFDMVDEPDHPDDIDLTAAYDLYMEALEMDGNHTGANFGAGILEVVMLTQDQQVQDFFDRVDAFVDADAFFEAPSDGGTFDGSLGVSGPIFSFDQLNIPLAMPVKLTRAFTRIESQTDPTINELQQICLSEILPRIATCMTRLTKVTTDQNYTFIVTPRMQGDVNEDPVELDMTEVYATMAGLSAVRAGLLHFTAYNFNFDEYTGAEMLEALTPGSSFGSLHGEGTARMHSALQAWKDAVSNLESAVNFLEAETDPQGDDLIHTDPFDDFNQADLDSIKHYIPIARNILTTSDEISLDWDGQWDTPDETIRFSLASFYSTPVQDLKSLVPPYTPSLDVTPVHTRWASDDSTAQAVVTVDAAGWYAWQRAASYFRGELDYEWHEVDFEAPEWSAVWDGFVARAMNAHDASIYVYFYGWLNQGVNTVQCNFHFNYAEVLRSRYVPVITWEADSFEEWEFPDPTAGGLMPGMTDPELKRIFGIDGNDWDKTVTLDIWD